MEVEAKFSLPDHEVYQRLQKTTRLAGFSLSGVHVMELHDTYVDTPGRKILAGGFACRFRQYANEIRVMLKRLGGVSGAIHKREEMELILPAVLPVKDWPAGPFKDLV